MSHDPLRSAPSLSAAAVADALRRVQGAQALSADRPLVVAFSGGLDSTVLLEACVRALDPRRLIAVHVHHGLQSQADAWAEHCAAQACARGVRFECLRLSPARPEGAGIEAWARRERYRALWAFVVQVNGTALLTAHQADDLAETLLMRLARGTGLDGLARALPAQATGPEGRLLLRPLLGLTRAQLLDEARRGTLAWIDDPMNFDTGFTRVRVRERVLPALEAAEPGALQRIARAQAQLVDAAAELDRVAQVDLEAARCAAGSQEPPALDRQRLQALSPYRQALLFRAWWRALAGEPTASLPSEAQLNEWRAQMIDAEATQAHVHLCDYLFVRYRDRIEAWGAESPIARSVWMRGVPQPPVLEIDAIGDGRPIDLPGWGASLRVSGGAGPVRVRVAPAAGTWAVRLRVGGPSRDARKLWQDRGVPPALRAWLPWVSVDGIPVLLAGVGPIETGGVNPLRAVFEPNLRPDPRARFCRTDSI